MALMGLDKLAGGTHQQDGDFQALRSPCGWIYGISRARFIPTSLYPLGMYQGTTNRCQLTRFHWTERRGPCRLTPDSKTPPLVLLLRICRFVLGRFGHHHGHFSSSQHSGSTWRRASVLSHRSLVESLA